MKENKYLNHKKIIERKQIYLLLKCKTGTGSIHINADIIPKSRESSPYSAKITFSLLLFLSLTKEMKKQQSALQHTFRSASPDKKRNENPVEKQEQKATRQR